MNIMKKRYKLIKVGVNIYYLKLIFKCFLAVEIDEKGHTDRDIIFEERRQKALEKKLVCKFIRVNAKNGCDLDYDVRNVQAFIDELKDRKKTINKRKRNEREIRKTKEKAMREKLEKEMKVENER